MSSHKAVQPEPRAMVTIRKVWEDDVIVEVKTFRIFDPEPHNQYRRAQLVTYIEKRRNRWELLVPDNSSYLIIEYPERGHLIYDSRDTIPCDMEKFEQNRLECQAWQRELDAEEGVLQA